MERLFFSAETLEWDKVLCCSFFFFPNESHASLQMIYVLRGVILVLKNFTGEMHQAYTSSGFENSS